MITDYLNEFIKEFPDYLGLEIQAFLWIAFFLIVAVFLSGAYFKKKAPDHAFQSFDSEYPLKRLLRIALHIISTNKWLLAFILLLILLSFNDGPIINWGNNPHYLSGNHNVISPCTNTIEYLVSFLSVNYLLFYFFNTANWVLSDVFITWYFGVGTISYILICIVLIVFFTLVFRNMANENKFRITKYYFSTVCVLGSLIILFLFLFSFNIKEINGNNIFIMSIISLLEEILWMLLYPIFVSIWFGLLFGAVVKWHANIESKISGSRIIVEPVLLLVLRIFPTIFVLYVPFIFFRLCIYYFQVFTKIYFPLFYFDIPASILGLYLFPLPFIVANYKVNILKGWSLLFGVWKYNFRKLLICALTLMLVSFPITLVTNYGLGISSGMIPCNGGLYLIFLFVVPIAFLLVPALAAQLAVMISFRVGVFDFPEMK
jgi:hypothetical protein